MAGIKFRRNMKVNLNDIQEAEIVYAIDTDEWGLGTGSGNVIWRSHELGDTFINNYLQGIEDPELGQGEVGDYFTNKLSETVFQKKMTGWEEINFPQDETSIPNSIDYIPKNSITDFDVLDTIITQDASVNLPQGFIPVDDNHPTTQSLVDEAFGGILHNDGTTPMVNGYVADTQYKVLTKLDTQSELNLKPVMIDPNLGGVIWNDNGVPRISVAPYSDIVSYFQQTPGAWNYFGTSVAIDDTYAIAGSHENNWGGSIQVNSAVDGSYLRTIASPYGSTQQTAFSSSVGISGGIIVAAAWNANPQGSSTGEVHIYNAVDGSHTTVIEAPDKLAGDKFGNRVAISSTRILVSTNKESVYVFLTDGTYVTKITAFDSAGTDRFGFWGIDVSDTHIVIGAYDGLNASGDKTGSVYVYDLDGVFIRKIYSPNAVIGDLFGMSVGVDGSFLAVGMYGRNNYVGGAELYNIDGTYISDLNHPDLIVDDEYGLEIALDGDKIVIGAEGDANYKGAAYVYDTSGAFISKILPPEPLLSEPYFAEYVAISNDVLMLSARNYDNGGLATAGAFYLVR